MVQVDVTSTQLRMSVRWKFTLTITAAPDGVRRIVRWTNPTILPGQQFDESHDQVLRVVVMQHALMAAAPELVVSPTGALVDIRIEPQEVLRVIFPAVVGRWRPQLVEAMTEAVERPEFRAIQADRAAALWNSWVGAWIELPTTPGPLERVDGRVEGLGGIAMRDAFGARQGPTTLPGHILLSRRTLTDMHAQSMHHFVQATMGGDLSGVSDGSPPATHEDAVEAVTDPGSLRPHSVRVTSSFYIMVPDPYPFESVYTFHWPAAQGADARDARGSRQ
jgi:hypothetical protein